MTTSGAAAAEMTVVNADTGVLHRPRANFAASIALGTALRRSEPPRSGSV